MNSIIDIIEKKKTKNKLSKEEINYFVKAYTNDEIPDYQASALIMAMFLNGMDIEETTNLTLAMANSGQILDFSDISNKIVDKHSTGGVGDKITLILMPILAALGVKIAKMSGRGLGFSGGTIDKLEAIPGYNTSISVEEFRNNIKEIGIGLMSQTLELAPADKKIYALRDSIACVNSMPLVASSIMSKKIATGTKHILLDVTCGSGAFMQDVNSAEELARLMINIGKLAKIKTVCVVTNMDQPLGYTIGNNLEVKEAIECLKGNMPEDINKVVLTCGSYMLKLINEESSIEENITSILEVIKSGKAYNKFKELVEKQYGDVTYIEDVNKFDKTKYIIPFKAGKDGFIHKIDAKKIGELSVYLGSGRQKKEDAIDYSVGIVLTKKVSEHVKQNEILGYIHSNDKVKAEGALEKIKMAYEIKPEKIEKPKEIIKIIV